MNKSASAQFTDQLNSLGLLRIPVNPPYLKPPKSTINDFGLPVKDYYTTQDLCKVLNIKPDTLRYRLRRDYYPESAKVGGKRRFTEDEIKGLIKSRSQRT